MAHTTFIRLLGITIATAVIAGSMLSQDLILNGNQTNNGLIKVRRDVINNTSAQVTVSGTGVVRLDRTADNHAIKSAAGTYPIAFSNLSMTQTKPVTAQVDVTVTNNLTIGDGSNPYTGSGNGFDIGARTLTISNLSSYLAGSTGPLTFSTGTVVYNSASSQTVLNRTAGVAYGTLTLSAAGGKIIPAAGGAVTVASLAQTGGQLTVNENTSITGSGSFADLGAIASGKKLLLTNTVSSGSVTAMSSNGTGTFENASNNTVTIATLASNSGTINQSGTSGAIAFTNNIANTGTITTATGTLDFNGTGANSNTGGTISVTGAGNAAFAGDIAASPGTLSFNSSSTVTYDGAAQNIAAATYGNLGAGGTGAKSANSALTIAGSIRLDQNITAAATLTMTSTIASNLSGTGEILGAVRRNHTFTTGQNYMFNRADVYLGTATLAGTDITLNMTAGTAPGGTLPSAKYVNRKYAVTAVNAGALQSVRLAYASGELTGGITDTKIGLRSYNGSAWSKVTNTGQTRTSSSTLMTYSGLSNALVTGELGMYGIDFRSSTNGANISLAGGFDENSLPDITDDIIIAHTGVQALGAGVVSAGTLTVNAGSDLTMAGSGALTVATAATVNGGLTLSTANANVAALTIGTTGAMTVASGRTLAGSTFTNNSGLTSTFTGIVSFGSLAHNGNGGTGTLNFNGSASITGAVTNAAGTMISVGGALSMLTGSVGTFTSPGNITVDGASGVLNIGAAGVASNLTLSGTSTLALNNAAGKLNVFGNLEIGASSTLSNAGEITVGE